MRMSASPSKRRDMDILKLMMSDYEVTIPKEDTVNDFYVKFNGPLDSPYEGGVWSVHVTLPVDYPYSSPSIGFANTVYHPNVDESSGSICLDVLNSKWTPMYDLINIFDIFLSQLLLYPNPSDPLNGEAAALYLQDKAAFDQKTREYVQKYAKEEDIYNLSNNRHINTTTTTSSLRTEDSMSDEDEDFFEFEEDEENFSEIDDVPDYEIEM